MGSWLHGTFAESTGKVCKAGASDIGWRYVLLSGFCVSWLDLYREFPTDVGVFGEGPLASGRYGAWGGRWSISKAAALCDIAALPEAA